MVVKIKVGDIKALLDSGKKVKVKTLNDRFVNVSKFIDKGMLETFFVYLDGGYSIKVSKNHKFFSKCGWIETKDLVPKKTELLCEDKNFHKVEKIEYLGKKKIVDITVDDNDHCYFGNGILNHNSGKSLISYHILANTQKMGGISVYIDTERSYNQAFMERMNINTKKLIMPEKTPQSIEEVFDFIEKVATLTLSKIPKRDKSVVVVWDSVASTPSKEELEIEYSGTPRMGSAARSMSRSLMKFMNVLDMNILTLVCINQLREKIGISFGDPTITPHGKSLAFYSSVRVKLTSCGQIKDTVTERVVGIKTYAKVVKNKIGPAYRRADFPIYYDWGINDELSWLEYMKELKIVEVSGAWSKLLINGQEHKFQGTAGWLDLMKDETIKNFILEKIDENMVYDMNKRPDSLEEAKPDLESLMEVEQIKQDL